MKAIKFTLIAGALIATAGVAAAQPGAGARGPAAEITRDQALARADQRFAQLDANRDGRLTVEEMRQGRRARMEQRAERRTQRQAQGQGQGQRQGQRGARMFERLDNNNDGQISREEFAQLRAMRGERRGHRGQRHAQGAGRMFGPDGVITREDFRARALQRFERLDANRDGRVTMAERQEARQRMRAERREAPRGN